jgi:hypothetical protein
MNDDSKARARYGWEALLPIFEATNSRVIRAALEGFIRDATPEQLRAWDASIPRLQAEFREVLQKNPQGHDYSAIL